MDILKENEILFKYQQYQKYDAELEHGLSKFKQALDDLKLTLIEPRKPDVEPRKKEFVLWEPV